MSMFKKLQISADKFWNSKYFIFINILAAVTGLAVKQALICMFIILAEAVFLLLFCDDMLSIAFPLFAIFLTSTEYFKDYSVLGPYMWYAIIPFAAAMIFQLVYYRKPFVKGRLLYPMLAVSLALILGGVGTIKAEDYFLPFSLYYVLGLGLGMTAIYCITVSRLQNERSYDRAERLTTILYAAGILAVLVLLVFYVQNFERFIAKGGALFYKPRNYLCTVIFLAMPPCCHYIKKNNLHLLIMAAMFATLFMSGSRSGLLIGTILLVICAVYVYATNKESRKLYNILIIIVAIFTVIVAFKFAPDIYDYLYSYRADEFDGKFISSNETRVQYIKLGLQDFKEHPIFGIGLGNLEHIKVFKAYFTGCIVFYHNCVIQIIGSMGLAGILAYVWLVSERVKLMWKTRKSDMMIFSLSYIGVILMSLVNPGIFCPFPEAGAVMLMFAIMEREQMKLK